MQLAAVSPPPVRPRRSARPVGAAPCARVRAAVRAALAAVALALAVAPAGAQSLGAGSAGPPGGSASPRAVAPAWTADWAAAIRAREHVRAEALAREAHARGEPYGAYLLGLMLRDGAGVERDAARARTLFGEAATSLPAAQAALGALLMRGLGGPVDLEGAQRHLARAAEAGSAEAGYQLSLLLTDPRHERRDPVAAFAAAHRAALAGHLAALGRVGTMVLAGEGVARDPDKALAWLRRGAERGDLASVGLLGEALVTGVAGERDPQRGEALLLRAAQAGHVASMALLADLYDKGTVLPRDYASAYTWASIALARGPATPALQASRDALERRLPPERVASIQAAARTWTPRRIEPGAPPQPGEEPRAGTGTAFFVSAEGHALTNAHVVRGCRRLTTAAHGEATVIVEDTAADLALVRVERPAPDWARFRDAAPRLGEPVYVFGYPLYGMLSTGGNFTSGLVSSLVGLRDDARRIQISAPIQPGNSGGPVLDRSGRVIAVAVSMLRADVLGARSQPQNVNFAIEGGSARKLLQGVGVQPELADEAGELSTEALAERARAVSTVLRCQR
jgi:TPR repeat protein